MKLKNIITASVAAISLCSVPFLAFAGGGFFIENDSAYDASFKINNGDCSTNTIGVKGLVQQNTLGGINNILTTTFCGSSTTNCLIDIYMTKDCTGKAVASVTFDINKGIVAVDNKKVDGFYAQKKSAQTVYITGGPLPAGK